MPTSESLQKEVNSLKKTNEIYEKRISEIEKRLDIQSEEEVEEVKPDKESHSLEEKIGLKWFARIGILAFVIGIGYFIKYAFDNNWIDYPMRVILGVIIGIILVIFGEIISKREKYFSWGLTLIGGGFAIVYFAIYAAYHFENYREAIGISQTIDIILLSVVVIFAIIFSLKNNSQIVFGEAFFLGYVTSFLSTNFETLTLIYGLVLSAGLVILVSHKKWSLMAIGGVIATYIVYIAWYSENLDIPDRFIISTAFLITYFILFTMQSFLLESDKKNKVDLHNVWISILNSIFFFILYFILIKKYHADFDGLFVFMLAVFYLIVSLLAVWLKRRNLPLIYLYLAILYLTLAIPLQFSKQWITLLWIGEALILTLFAVRFDMEGLRYTSYLVGLLTAAKILFIDSRKLHEFDFGDIFNSTRFFIFLIAILVFYFLAWYLDKNKKKLDESDSFMPGLYTVLATIMAFVLIFLEMKDFWISVGWTVLALVILIAGFIIKKKGLRFQGMIIFGITILKVFLYDTSELAILYRTISFIVLGAILLLASFLYNKYKDKLKEIIEESF